MSATRRLVLDVTTSVRWMGPPVGIVRVEQELVRYARQERPDIVLAFYDPAVGYRALDPGWVELATSGAGSIDILHFTRLRGVPAGWRRWLPSRLPLVLTLERMRLSTSSRTIRLSTGALQRMLLLLRRQPPFFDAGGNRIDLVPAAQGLGEALRLGSGDILVAAGSFLSNERTDEIEVHKRDRGLRCVALCYDIIPLLFPEWYLEADVANFRCYWSRMFALADRIIVNARATAADVRRYCTQAGIRLADVAVIRLGHDLPVLGDGAAPLPPGLEPGRFALMVATIEPRKGHALVLRIWQRLLAEGVPQRHRFKLVLVGRRGWKVEELVTRIDAAATTEGMLMHFAAMPDELLAALYRASAFCLLPAMYEGFGLPIVEAYAHGKAVLVSTGGALPEAADGLSPCLDPTDEDAWYAALRQWIEHPEMRRDYEARIRTASFPTWKEAAASFFAAAALD